MIGKEKIVVKKYQTNGLDLSKKYNAVLLADLHLVKSINRKMLNNINNYLIQVRKNIDFIFMSGDLSYYKYYLDNSNFDYLKSTIHNFSELAEAPLYACLGNHDFGIFSNENEELIRKRFDELKYNSNIIPLDNKRANFNEEITITGITPDNSIYKSKTYNGENGVILNDTLKQFDKLDDKYSIALIHDPLSVYYASKNNSEHVNKYNLILCGHEHGGYLSEKQMIKKNDGYGYVEYFRNFKPYMKIPCCYGKYKLTNNTEMIVTEGIKRFNGYIPSFIYTTPFVTEIEIKPKKLVKHI